ncbi:MAG: cyclic nucleotide-binding domain-containing protein [Clostridia bacterium]|nr:cyclic nucleotide-binding domain-containing protein [Clostridia bacterium]
MNATFDPVRYNKGDIVFREGEYGSSMYDIRWGSVGVYAGYGGPDEKRLTTLHAGEYFGELGLLDTMPRSATIVVEENGTQLLEITIDGFSDYFNNKPEKILKIMEHMSIRMRELTDDYLDACRTISEYLEEAEQDTPKKRSLLEKMKRFALRYRQLGR